MIPPDKKGTETGVPYQKQSWGSVEVQGMAWLPTITNEVLVFQASLKVPFVGITDPLEQYLETALKDAFLKFMSHRDFPGGPVGKTPQSQCRGPRFDPWSGN